MRSSAAFETCILDKPYFDPKGLIIAETDDGHIVGFVQAGFAPTEDQTAIRWSHGVICMIAVRPLFRRLGIGEELLSRAESYLRGLGATSIYSGGQRPTKPFYMGIYGGSNAPGFLMSDPEIHPFLKKHGYQANGQINVLQRRVDTPINIVDPQFTLIRKKYETHVTPHAQLGSWWRESIVGPLDPNEFRLDDRQTGVTAAKALFWEMKDYGWRWGAPAAGIIDVYVRPELRRQKLGKYLIAQLLRHLAEQYFAIIEIQIPSTDELGLKMFHTLGFNQVDTGIGYVKHLD